MKYFFASVGHRVCFLKCQFMDIRNGGYYCPLKQKYFSQTLDCVNCSVIKQSAKLRATVKIVSKRRRLQLPDNFSTSIPRVATTSQEEFHLSRRQTQ